MSLVANRLFIREAELIVGTKGGSAGTIPADARVIKNRLKFTVEKNSEGNSNKATIAIFNLSQDTRNFLEKTDNYVILRAGYQDAISAIFTGDVLKGKHERSGPDITTTLECGDGELALRDAVVSVGLGPGATNTQIINQAVAAITGLSVARGYMDTIPTRTFANGFTYSGPAKSLLKEQLRAVGLEFHIQDGELNIMVPDKTDLQLAVEITPETGLIGFPTKTPEGVDFVSLLNPFIRPGRAIKIESKQFQGAFGSQSGVAASAALVHSGSTVRCRRVVFEGDTKEGPWQSKAECVAIGGSSG